MGYYCIHQRTRRVFVPPVIEKKLRRKKERRNREKETSSWLKVDEEDLMGHVKTERN